MTNSRVTREVLWGASLFAVVVGPVDRLLTLQEFLGAGDIASDAALLGVAIIVSVLSVCLAALHLVIAAIRAPKIIHYFIQILSNFHATKMFFINGDDNSLHYSSGCHPSESNNYMLNLRVTREVFGSASLVQGTVTDDGVGGDGGRDAGDQQERLHHGGEF